jgi:ribosome biogenesis protein Nip4
VSVIAHRLQPGKDNAHWLALIKRFAPVVVPQLEKILADNQEKAAALFRKGEQDHVKHLAREHDIQGSAVVPNLNKDAPIREKLSAFKIETRERIDNIIQKSN